MNLLPEKLRDLITSEEKRRIYETVSSFSSTFTGKDVVRQLQQQGIKVKLPTVHALLRALSFRKYLLQSTLKLGTTRGRSTNHFQKAEQFIKI